MTTADSNLGSSQGMRVGEIAELWQYPVKSMRGVRVNGVELDAMGVVGDRRFAFASSNAPSGKPLLASRERAAMLLYRPESAQGGHIVQTPNGDQLPLQADALLQHFENASGDSGGFRLLSSPERPLTDVRPVSLVSSATLQAFGEELGYQINPQRFRSNIVLHLDEAIPFGEDAWSGRTLRFGFAEQTAELLLQERIPRCRMVSLDPETSEPDTAILRQLARAHEGRLGVYASVRRAGELREGQAVFLL